MKTSFFLCLFLLCVWSVPSNALESVVQQATSLRQFPDDKSQSVAVLPSGAILEVLQQFNEWSLVEFTLNKKTKKGWLRTNQLAQRNSSTEGVSPTLSKPVSDADHHLHLSLAVNPVTIFFPWIEVQIGLQVHPLFRFNITPMLYSWGYGRTPFRGWLYGVNLSGTFFFEPNGGWYLEPGAIFLANSRYSGRIAGGQLIGGFEKRWSSGMFLNLGLGAGVAHYWEDRKKDDWFNLSGTFPYPTYNLLLGYRF